MKFVIWLCLTSLFFSVASAANSDFLDILNEAQKTAGDDPKASLKLLATIDGRFPSTEKGISFQKDLLKERWNFLLKEGLSQREKGRQNSLSF